MMETMRMALVLDSMYRKL